MKHNLRFIIFISFLNFAFFSNQYITKGINKIIDRAYFPIIFDANENCLNIIISEYIYVVNKEDNSIKFQKEINAYNPPSLLYIDKLNNYFFIEKIWRLKILLNENNEIFDLVNDDFTLDQNLNHYFGYILLKESNTHLSSES